MALEKRWEFIPVRAFTANGTNEGVVTISSTIDFKVKQPVTVKASTLLDKRLEVKRVLSLTQLVVGPPGAIKATENISVYTTGLGASISALEEDRNSIPEKEYSRAVYAEGPIVAYRTIPVDRLGKYFSKDNPFPVQLSDGSVNIETLNANLLVQLSHKDNDPNAGDVHDSVRVGDGTDEMEVNSDGSINVNLVSSVTGPSEVVKTKFDEAPSVASGSETSVVSYTVPSGKTARLHRVTYSGENVATYNLYIAGSIEERRRTHFGADLTGDMRFTGAAKEGPLYPAGTVIQLKVLHTRPSAASFNGRIQVLEIG